MNKILTYEEFINEAYEISTDINAFVDKIQTPGLYVALGDNEGFEKMISQAGSDFVINTFNSVFSYCCYTYDDSMNTKNPDHDSVEKKFPAIENIAELADDPNDIYNIIDNSKKPENSDARVLVFVPTDCAGLPDIIKLKRNSVLVLDCNKL